MAGGQPVSGGILHEVLGLVCLTISWQEILLSAVTLRISSPAGYGYENL